MKSAVQEGHQPPRNSESRFSVHLETRKGLLEFGRTRQLINPMATVSTFQMKMMSPGGKSIFARKRVQLRGRMRTLSSFVAVWPSFFKHHHNRSCTVHLHHLPLSEEGGLDRLQRDQIHWAIAWNTFQTLFNDKQLGRVNQEGQSTNVWLRHAHPHETGPSCLPIDQLKNEIQDFKVFVNLSESHIQCLVPLKNDDRLLEFGRTSQVIVHPFTGTATRASRMQGPNWTTSCPSTSSVNSVIDLFGNGHNVPLVSSAAPTTEMQHSTLAWTKHVVRERGYRIRDT